MQTKTMQVQMAVASGDWKTAMKIAATFRVGYSKDEQRTIQIAKECFTGKQDFYIQLGLDTASITEQAKHLIFKKYGKETTKPNRCAKDA